MVTFVNSLAFIDGLGGGEMGLIFIIVLVLFGGDKLPGFARGLGKAIREFKKAAAGVEDEFKRALEEEPKKDFPPQPAILPPTSTPALEAPTAEHYDGDEYHRDHYQDHEAAPQRPAAEQPALPAPASTALPEPGAVPPPAATAPITAAPAASPAPSAPTTPPVPPSTEPGHAAPHV